MDRSIASRYGRGHLKNWFDEVEAQCSEKKRKVIIFSDNKIKLASPFKTYTFLCTENQKNRANWSSLGDILINNGIGRSDLLIIAGGGVMCDLGAFVAATYCRGIDHILIPTTLIAQVDAAWGGKCGVNHPLAKNYFGAFHEPVSVWVDPEFLQTLPEQEYHWGLAEFLKHALIADRALFFDIKKNAEGLLRRDKDVIDALLPRSIAVKQAIVKKDPYEKIGLRRALNFGHTFAHAIEQASDYTISHGKAVAKGLWLASELSHAQELLPIEELEEIRALLIQLKLTVELPSLDFSAAMQRDKKAKNGSVFFVLLEKIGNVASFGGAYCQEVDLCTLSHVVQKNPLMEQIS